MLQIHLNGDLSTLTEGLKQIENQFHFQNTEAGTPILVRPSTDGKHRYSFDGTEGIIEYSTKNSFFRLLNLWLYEMQNQQPFSQEENPQFEKVGVMVDTSRNAVLKVAGMKNLLDYMAKMGLNMAMLYTEDTYTVEEYPYFGYLRGRYTQAELQELDDYADALGIEMIPCIQTLGHLQLALQYEYAGSIRDTHDVLLVGEPKTYEFLDNLIRAASAPFRSKRIHIGMDEAFGLGEGAYRIKNGIRDSFTIMNEHLSEVVAITEKYGLEPMMWSDMYYRFGSKTGDYYDLNSEIPAEVIKEIPEVDMVFWDYYHEDEKAYDTYFEKHLDMQKKVIFAGGIWTWNGVAPNYGKTFATTIAGLNSSKRKGLKEVFATLWGDDGGETPILTALPGMQLYAEMAYREEVDQARLEKEFFYNTGYHLEEFLALNELDETPGVMENNINISATSKILLWQDPLLGLFDKTIEGLDLCTHYEEVAAKIKRNLEKNPRHLETIFTFYQQLAHTLSMKAEFGVCLKKAYDEKNHPALQRELGKAKELLAALRELRLAHRRVWMKYNKPFGWEVMDIRYGGAIARMDTVIDTLALYLEGTISTIAELEEEKLPFSNPYNLGTGTLGRGLYKDMVTAGKLSGV